MDAGAVKKKLNVLPPFTDVNLGEPLPTRPYVGTLKSVERPVVGLNAFMTVTVHEITSLIRTTVDEVLVWPMHNSVDDAVGVPSTANENVLPVITLPPLSFSVMANTAVITVGAVTKKLNVEPELVVTNVGDPAPLGPNTGTMKSDEIATEAPAASLTVTVHEITSLTRT